MRSVAKNTLKKGVGQGARRSRPTRRFCNDWSASSAKGGAAQSWQGVQPDSEGLKPQVLSSYPSSYPSSIPSSYPSSSAIDDGYDDKTTVNLGINSGINLGIKSD